MKNSNFQGSLAVLFQTKKKKGKVLIIAQDTEGRIKICSRQTAGTWDLIDGNRSRAVCKLPALVEQLNVCLLFNSLF